MLEPKIKEITLTNRVDDKLQMELTSILLIIMYHGRLYGVSKTHTDLVQATSE